MSVTAWAYIVDSFTSEAFKGNPAGVVVAGKPFDEQRMQAIAKEFNFSETAFVVPGSVAGVWSIRYFSPIREIALCGHATLAAAKVLFQDASHSSVQFATRHGLNLEVRRSADRIEMVFPNYGLKNSEVPAAMLNAIGIGIDEVLFAGFSSEANMLMLEIESATLLRSLKPDFDALVASHDSIVGVSVTARGDDEFDFHSRFFWPWAGGEEDPVTGSAHSFLAPYWSKKIGRTRMQAFQASRRSGSMEVEIADPNTVLIRGHAVLILEGNLNV